MKAPELLCIRRNLSNFREFNQGMNQAYSLIVLLFARSCAHAQSLINLDFGAGSVSAKSGFAATGQSTNDFWNRYRHYEPKFLPGMAAVANGHLDGLKY